MTKYVFAVATMDTKGEEIAYVADCLRRSGLTVRTLDVGALSPSQVSVDISRDELLSVIGKSSRDVAGLDRAAAVATMRDALQAYLLREHQAERVGGVLGIGGSGGTALISAAMRALPIGMPKVMVSTVASGNTEPYVGCSDITMVYSVVDIAGLNAISRRVLGNAANAMAGMLLQPVTSATARTTLGMTMFGVTTPCVTAVREMLTKQEFDCLVFHATGTGGRAMEKLVESGFIQGVLDLTTTEVADEVVGGVFPSGPARFDIIGEKRLPYVLSLGALDMVNFGAMETVPPKFAGRKLHVHNSQVTLMRTTPDENRRIGKWIAEKLNRFRSRVVVIIPEHGLSALDAPGQPFHDPAANHALFEELQGMLHEDEYRSILRIPLHINDGRFASMVSEVFLNLFRHKPLDTN